MMGIIPLLSTKRLTLRPFQETDAEDVARYVSERVIAANTLSIPHPYTTQMAVEWIETHSELFSEKEGVNFAITDRKTGDLLGAIGLVIQLEHDRAELGYWVGKPHWNQGYATEAARQVIDFGFMTLNLERIYAQHFTRNPASGRVMLKNGMQYEGCLRHHIKKWEKYQDIKIYSILRSEWQPLRNQEK
ncbi:MAG: GNAT family N-acetyltransferase [Anaerolineales bacterium]|jgi:RimJ/RimL family protein N-acetyltransferase